MTYSSAVRLTYPKPIDESIAQAQTAASRAITLLAQKNIWMDGTGVYTNPMGLQQL